MEFTQDQGISGGEELTCQEHFYLECNAALAVPGEADEPLEVNSETHRMKLHVCD